MNPKVIIIRGPLGIGKSTISKLVAKRTKSEYYSIDEILEKNNLDVIDWEMGCIPEPNFIKANEIAVLEISDNLKNNQSVVIDGNFYHKKALEHLIETLKEFETIVFTLKAGVEICIKRDSLREKPHGKDAAVGVHELVSKFNYGKVIINEDTDIESKVEEIINYLE